MVIPHTQIEFYIVILICRNMHRMITAIGKTLRNHQRIPLIRFDPFPCCVSMVVGARMVHRIPFFTNA